MRRALVARLTLRLAVCAVVSALLMPGLEAWVIGTGAGVAAGGPLPPSALQPPRVVQVYPSDGQRYVPVDANIHILFSEPMDRETTIGAFSMFPDPGFSYPTSFQFLNKDAVMVVIPARPLAYGTKYTIVIRKSARDLQNTELEEEYSWSFTTVQGPPPARELPRNGHFSAGLASWRVVTGGAEPKASLEAVKQDDREHAVRFERPKCVQSGWAAIEQDLDVALPQSGLVFISFEVRIGDYGNRVYVDRSDAHLYPAKVVLSYLDASGTERAFTASFYYYPPASGGLDSYAEFIELDRWVSRSYNLAMMRPRPERLKKIRFEAGGFGFVTWFDEVRIVW